MTDLSELKRLAEAVCTKPTIRHGFVGPQSTHSAMEGVRTDAALLSEFHEKATPMAILSLIKRVEEAEGEVVKQSLTTAESHARGVAEGLERAAKVAEGVDPVSGERGQAWVAHSLYDNMRKHVAAAIRKGE